MKKHIPNIITCLNVTCGSIAIVAATLYNDIIVAACFILLGMVFDFFDGLTARALGVKSELGKELDSLADVCSFGVAPAILAYLLISESVQITSGSSWLAVTPILIPALSAYRLAKFNLDTRQTVSFIGMPTPANALFWVGLVFGKEWAPEIYDAIFGSPVVLAIFAVGFAIALISELPMFSLKLQGFGWRGNELLYIFLAFVLVLIPIVGAGTTMFIIPLYFVICLLGKIIGRR